VTKKSENFLICHIIYGEISSFRPAIRSTRRSIEYLTLGNTGHCWNRHEIKRGNQLRSPGHLSEWTTSLDGTQSYDAENMINEISVSINSEEF